MSLDKAIEHGKERRKRTAGKEGKLGVEGMKPEILLSALEKAGATFEDAADVPPVQKQPVTKADLFVLGLSGGADSVQRRKALLKHLGLPEHMTANALLETVNILFDRQRFLELATAVTEENP